MTSTLAPLILRLWLQTEPSGSLSVISVHNTLRRIIPDSGMMEDVDIKRGLFNPFHLQTPTSGALTVDVNVGRELGSIVTSAPTKYNQTEDMSHHRNRWTTKSK